MHFTLPFIAVAAIFFPSVLAGPEDPTPCAFYLSKANRKNAAVITKIEKHIKEKSTDADALYTSKSEYLGTFSWVGVLKEKDCLIVYEALKADVSNIIIYGVMLVANRRDS